MFAHSKPKKMHANHIISLEIEKFRGGIDFRGQIHLKGRISSKGCKDIIRYQGINLKGRLQRLFKTSFTVDLQAVDKLIE